MRKINPPDLKDERLSKNKKQWLVILAVLVVSVLIATLCAGVSFSKDASHAEHDLNGGAGNPAIRYWTCSMHPQIKLPKEGSCPICAMDLIPVYENIDEEGEGSVVSLTLSETAQKLAEVETTEAVYKVVTHEVRLIGKVDYDETALSYISAWVPGRIERLFVDFTGTKVRQGDHLIKLYSPELVATQAEYLHALKNLEETQASQMSLMRDTAQSTLESAREKLRLYGITKDQIDALRARGTPDEHMTIYSPVTGTVIHKNGFEGMYVKTGDKIYTIADLSKVWLYLEAYESDIQWLHYGQEVIVEAESYPGEVFRGKIAFIDPFVDEKTRTINLRVNVDNPGEKLKPGMFVRTTIQAVLGTGGTVYAEDLAGKLICPMHPDIIKDEQAPCDLCGMDLIPTSEFGFADTPLAQKEVLVIPRSAPLITGKRAVVYVENETEKATTKRYEGREVVLGPRAGEEYMVFSGVQAGERVVTNGNFKIDSALQIQAKPSMMNPAGYYSEKDTVISQSSTAAHADAGILKDALPFYFAASSALARDDPHSAAEALESFQSALADILAETSVSEAPGGIRAALLRLSEQIRTIEHALTPLRKRFADISITLKNIFESYAYTEDRRVYIVFCPMAFDNAGGYWLQDSEKIENPYFGASMFSCGELTHEYGRMIQKSKPVDGHAAHAM